MGISLTIWKQSAPRSRQTTTPAPHHAICTGPVLNLTPNPQCQSTEGTTALQNIGLKCGLNNGYIFYSVRQLGISSGSKPVCLLRPTNSLRVFFIPDQIDRSGRTPATLLIWKCYDSCVVSSDRQNRTVQFLIKSFTGISYPVSSAFSHVVYYNSLGRGY